MFADIQHHDKEEDHLFPKLRRTMPMDGGPVSMILMEHQMGRSHIARMAEAAKSYAEGNGTAGAEWADAALDYVALPREHIYKENNVLFAMADQVLTQNEQEQLASAFAGVDTQTAPARQCRSSARDGWADGCVRGRQTPLAQGRVFPNSCVRAGWSARPGNLPGCSTFGPSVGRKGLSRSVSRGWIWVCHPDLRCRV